MVKLKGFSFVQSNVQQLISSCEERNIYKIFGQLTYQRSKEQAYNHEDEKPCRGFNMNLKLASFLVLFHV